MAQDIRVAVVGLDTSHSVEFVRRMQAPDCAPALKVPGLRATACLRFETPFQNAEGLDARQRQLEAWGVKVTTSFAESVADCDAIMIEINDPAFHLDYFRRCVSLGKPIFLDKPLADGLAAGCEVRKLADTAGVPVMSCSSLRFVNGLVAACGQVPAPAQVAVFGALGRAPAGSSVVWYGVHAFEMLERAMGRGATRATVVNDACGITAVIEYDGGRHGVVELVEGAYSYGGTLRGNGKAAAFVADMSLAYTEQLSEVERFFRTGQSPVTLDDAVEVLAMLVATERALQSGRPEPVENR